VGPGAFVPHSLKTSTGRAPCCAVPTCLHGRALPYWRLDANGKRSRVECWLRSSSKFKFKDCALRYAVTPKTSIAIISGNGKAIQTSDLATTFTGSIRTKFH